MAKTASEGYNEWQDSIREIRSLGQEIMDQLEEQPELLKKINDQEKIYFSMAEEAHKLRKGDLKTLQTNLSGLKSRVSFEIEVANRYAELKEQGNIFTEWYETVRKLWVDLKAIAQDPLLATALLTTAIARDFGKFVGATFEAQQNLGLAGNQALKMSKSIGAAGVSGVFLGYGMREAAEAAQSLSEASSDLTYVNNQNVKMVAKMASWYGISAQDAGKLQVMSGEIGANTLETYVNMANMAGAIPGKIMSDMASNSEYFAKYSKQGGKNIAEAAIAAQQLGISLAEVEGISDGLLDVQSSIEAEMNASVLLGKSLNLNRARELALAGDQAGMMQEVVRQLGSANEWERMNVIQRQAFSEALGLSVSQMQTMISQQADLNNQAAMQETTWGRVLMKLRGVAKGAMEYKETLIASGNFLFAMGHNMKALGGIANALGGPFKRLSASASKLFGAGGVTGGGGGFSKGVQSLSQTMGKINMTSVVKGAAAMAIMAGALWIFGKAIQEIAKVENVWKTLAVAGVALLGFTITLAAIGAIMTSGVGAIAFLAGAGAFVIMAGALWVLGKALQQISIPMESFTSSISQLGALAGVMPQIGAGFAAMGIGMMGFATSLLMMTPLLPVLAAITGLTAIQAKIAGGKEQGPGGVTNQQAEMLNELKAIRTLLEQGADIRINEKSIGRWMGKYQSSVNALEN